MARGGRREGAGRPKGSRNRGPKPTKPPAPRHDDERRQAVALCSAAGMPRQAIAAACGISEVELIADFAHELEHGADIVRAQQLVALSTAAAGGNAAAAKALLAVTERQVPEAVPAQMDPMAERTLRLLKGGKK